MMTYKTILVHVNDERRLPRLLEAATRLAEKHSAHIIGASVVPPFMVPGGDPVELPHLMEAFRDAYRLEEARMQTYFDKVTREQASPGAYTAEWRSLDPGVANTTANVLMPLARTADLIVASQPDPEWTSSDMLDLADHLATLSGRPVLVVPNKAKAPFAASRILVAWNGKREATRAVFDALPLLKAASEVKVLWVDPRDRTDADLSAADLCAALSRHGVKCEETASLNPKSSPGETLLFEASRYGGELLVMGCYGHSWLREFIIGGATRHVLHSATIPVLMSH
jgi:nucleotide-binding universal stress UspA family protein